MKPQPSEVQPEQAPTDYDQWLDTFVPPKTIRIGDAEYTYEEYTRDILGVGQGGHSPATMAQTTEWGIPLELMVGYATATALFNSNDVPPAYWERRRAATAGDDQAGGELLGEVRGGDDVYTDAEVRAAKLAVAAALGRAAQVGVGQYAAVSDMPTFDQVREDCETRRSGFVPLHIARAIS